MRLLPLFFLFLFPILQAQATPGVEALYQAPFRVSSSSDRPGRLHTIVWDHATQTYVLSASSSYSSPFAPHILAHGLLSDASVDKSGWWQLAISTRPPAHDDDTEDEDEALCLRRWYASGLLEGFLTAPLIAEYALNAKHSLFGTTHYPSDALLDFFEENYAWVHHQVNHAQPQGDEEVWWGAAAVLAQFEGLVAGYQATPTHTLHPLSSLELYLLNSYGDIFDLSRLFPAQPLPPTRLGTWLAEGVVEMREEEKEEEDGVDRDRDNDRCSVLVKATPGGDVLVGHATYDYYMVAWPRLAKETVLPALSAASPHWTRALFSASPGLLASLDDLYVLRGEGGGRDKRMVITETSLSMKAPREDALLHLLTPESLLYWMRVGIANAWAQDGHEWTQTFAQENSGTYNCEWMVVDDVAHTFHVLEQAPGIVKVADRTASFFPSSYWASFNVPSDREIYDLLGFGLKDPTDIKYALELYEDAPRAVMLREGQEAVDSVVAMRHLIALNDWAHDPRSLGHAFVAVAGRGDLEPEHELTPEEEYLDVSPIFSPLEGAIDGKVVSVREVFHDGAQHLSLHARVGPTHDQQPPFCWEERLGSRPECFEFAWDRLSPGTLLAEAVVVTGGVGGSGTPGPPLLRGGGRGGGGGK